MATVVVDAAPRPDAVALLCHVKADALVLAAEDVAAELGTVADLFPLDLPAAVVLIAGPATVRALEPGRLEGVMGILLKPLRAEELHPTLEAARVLSFMGAPS